MIKLSVGDTIQWCKCTPAHVITKIEKGEVHYHDTDGTDKVKTILQGIESLNSNIPWMYKYTPIVKEKKPKMENKIIPSSEVQSVIKKSNGQIFTVAFRKRTNGELRIMNARLGVQKDLTGKGMSYNPKNYGLMTVFDMQKQEYRTIDVTAVIWAKVNGTTYTVDK